MLTVEFLVAALIMELTPGPNMTWLALLSAQRGRRSGLMAVAGIATGLLILGAAAWAGAGALLLAYPWAYEAVRWAGVLFILYLAYDSWKKPANVDVRDIAALSFRRGLVVNVLNPKAAALYVVVIPAFAGTTDAFVTAVYTGSYILIATAVHVLIVVFASRFETAFNDPSRESFLRRLFAALLVGVAIWLAFSTAR